MSKLGDRLRELRGNMSLREAAERTGISHGYLDKLEKGVDPRTGKLIEPSITMLRKLSAAYNYPYEELLKEAGVLTGDELQQEPLLHAENGPFNPKTEEEYIRKVIRAFLDEWDKEKK